MPFSKKGSKKSDELSEILRDKHEVSNAASLFFAGDHEKNYNNNKNHLSDNCIF